MYQIILTREKVFRSSIEATNYPSEEITKDEETKVEIEEEIEVPEIKVDVNELYCWVDLMPGGPNRFQISGDVTVSDSYKFDLKFIKLKSIQILQNSKQIFSIRPKVKLEDNPITKEGKNFVFSTIKGLSLSPIYNIDLPVDVKIIFIENDDEFEFNIFKQSVEKVY